MTTVGQETLNTPVYVQVDSTRCHVMCDVTARYALIGQPRAGGCRAAKLLRMAVFVPATCTSVTPDYNLRVYCVDDTIDAVQVCPRSSKALSTLATRRIRRQFVAEFGDSRRFWRQSPNLATIVASVDRA